MSIKPDRVREIHSYEKEFEYSKVLPKHRIDRVFVYVTSPVKRITCVFDVEYILHSKVENLWRYVSHLMGLSVTDDDYVKQFNEFWSYFYGSKEGSALKITNICLLEPPIDPYVLKDFKPPQIYKYIYPDDSLYKLIQEWEKENYYRIPMRCRFI